METLTLNITDKSILPSLKKILGALDGVTIIDTPSRKKTEMQKARDDVKAGRLISYANKEDLFTDLGI